MPQLRDWVREKFGGTGTTLLDEEAYPTRELRKDIHNQEHEQDQLKQELLRHKQRYRQLLKEGAEKDSEIERSTYAQKAKIEKQKYQAKKQQFQVASQRLQAMVSIKGMREIIGTRDTDRDDITAELQDADLERLQEEMRDVSTETTMELEDLQALTDELELNLGTTDAMVDTNDAEMQTMEQLREGDLAAEELDIEADASAEADLEEGLDLAELDDELA